MHIHFVLLGFHLDRKSKDQRANITVALTSPPKTPVIVYVVSSDVTEGMPSSPTLNFNKRNWNRPQTINIVGVDDFSNDNDVAYTVTLATGSSADSNPAFAGLVSNFSYVNLDDDEVGMIAIVLKGNTSEGGESCSFVVKLTSQPKSSVVCTVSSNDNVSVSVCVCVCVCVSVTVCVRVCVCVCVWHTHTHTRTQHRE